MNKIFVIIGLLLVLPMMAEAYNIEDGKVILDNTDAAIIMDDYDGSIQVYVTKIALENKLISVEDTFKGRFRLSQVTGSSNCNSCINCVCTDTDPDDDIEVKGGVHNTYSYKDIEVETDFSDVCKKDLGFSEATGVIQVSCDGNNVCNYAQWALWDCPNNDCKNGTCTKLQIPEFTSIGLVVAVLGALAIIVHKKR
ncbi:MAG: hypothetical protein ACP5OA_01985 [Candidatus Woesearchaeota archaeon]